MNIITDSNYNQQISKIENEIIKDKKYLVKLNKKNLNDLDAIYFFDKININKNSKTNKKEGNKINQKRKNSNVIPRLNLEPDYIEDCKTKELLKLEEANLTHFQRIALQFEIS